MDIIHKLNDWLTAHDCNIEYRKTDITVCKNPVLYKFENIEKLKTLIEFWNFFQKVVSSDTCAWFLCEQDFKAEYNASEFAWNEFEKISLNAAADTDERNRVTEWWSKHLPIAMSVRGEYSFLAIDLGEKFGSIVYGYEPEFEETPVIARDFDDLIGQIISGSFSWL